MLEPIPDAWGPKRVTDCGGVTRTRTGPNEIGFTPEVHLALVMLTPQPKREIALGGARRAIGLAPVGAVEIVPAGADLFARWRSAKESMLFAFSPEQVLRQARADFEHESFHFRPPALGVADKMALSIARMAREELQRGEAASDICVDSLITLLAAHVLRRYSSLGDRPEPRHTGGLSPRKWALVSGYIKENITKSLSVDELAGLVGLSPSHFLRAFRQTSGLPPHQYVISHRLAFAEHLILRTDLPLATVATTVGFSSNSHLTSTMRTARGYTPKELRQG